MSAHGKLTSFLTGVPGYFREGEAASFPWDSTDRSVWYALLVVEEGQIHRYGFTSATESKNALCDALEALAVNDEALLLGVWNGAYSTHLFVLQPADALAYIRGSMRFEKYRHMKEIVEAELILGKRSKYLSYSYRGDQGYVTHTGTRKRKEVADLLEYFEQRGIKVQERHE